MVGENDNEYISNKENQCLMSIQKYSKNLVFSLNLKYLYSHM